MFSLFLLFYLFICRTDSLLGGFLVAVADSTHATGCPAGHALEGVKLFRSKASFPEEVLSHIMPPVTAMVTAEGDGNPGYREFFISFCICSDRGRCFLTQLYALVGWLTVFKTVLKQAPQSQVCEDI